MGVTSPLGSFIDKRIELSSKANLFWLSPGGLYLGSGSDFVNTPQLRLSTASSLKFDSGQFDVFSSIANDLALLRGEPLPGVLGLKVTPQLNRDAGVLPGIHLNGINISIDEDLLIDAPGGQLGVENSTISVSTNEGKGGSLSVTGQQIDIDGNSQLLATGPEGGGLIQVGGSWQNSDPTVRQAVRATVESGALLDASAIENGDGGEIVVWSDITNPESVTSVTGSLLVDAGFSGGDGGQIETSGAELDIVGIDVSMASEVGRNGLWLLDPTDFRIGADAAAAISSALNSGDVTVFVNGGSCDFNSTNCTDTPPAGGGLDSISGGGADDRIIVNDLIFNNNDVNHTLTLEAPGGVVLNNDIVIAGLGNYSRAGVVIKSTSGGLSGSGTISANSIVVNQGGDSIFNGTVNIFSVIGSSPVDPNGSFSKLGSGKLVFAGSSSALPLDAQVNFVGGTLEVDSSSFFDSSHLRFSGGTLRYGSSLLSSPIDLSNRLRMIVVRFLGLSNTAVVTFSSAIDGLNNSLEKLGDGTLALTSNPILSRVQHLSMPVRWKFPPVFQIRLF